MSHAMTQSKPHTGYCPKCSRLLSSVTVDARGFCELHGWQFANWSATEPDWDCWQCEDGEALRAGQTCLTCGIQRLEEK